MISYTNKEIETIIKFNNLNKKMGFTFLSDDELTTLISNGIDENATN